MEYVEGFYVPDGEALIHQIDHLKTGLGYVKNKRSAIDVGANIGMWTKLLCGEFDRVFSFEPAEDAFECLVANNQLADNLTCYNHAVGAKPGWCSLHDRSPKAKKTRSQSRWIKRTKSSRGSDASIVILDSMIPIDVNVDFLKIDVEGAEYDALIGGQHLIRRCRPVIMMEENRKFSKRFGRHHRDARNFLLSIGYGLKKILRYDGIFVYEGDK